MARLGSDRAVVRHVQRTTNVGTASNSPQHVKGNTRVSGDDDGARGTGRGVAFHAKPAEHEAEHDTLGVPRMERVRAVRVVRSGGGGDEERVLRSRFTLRRQGALQQFLFAEKLQKGTEEETPPPPIAFQIAAPADTRPVS